jgi:hypothetical protein
MRPISCSDSPSCRLPVTTVVLHTEVQYSTTITDPTLFHLKSLVGVNDTQRFPQWDSSGNGDTGQSTLSKNTVEQPMKRETILVIVMVLILLLLFLVVIVSDAVATAIFPVVSQEERVSSFPDSAQELRKNLTVDE